MYGILFTMNSTINATSAIHHIDGIPTEALSKSLNPTSVALSRTARATPPRNIPHDAPVATNRFMCPPHTR